MPDTSPRRLDTLKPPMKLAGKGRAAKPLAATGEPEEPMPEAVVLNVLPDPGDLRDQLFVPTLREVPVEIPLGDYRGAKVPILNQGTEGACTGFALATVAHYLLRRRVRYRDETKVSARMFYEMAKRYDEWEGEDYSGSSARGAMKGWHKHGVCTWERWPYLSGTYDPDLSPVRASEALERPLGAYFRVNHQDLVAMHTALAEVEILFATARVHAGWRSPKQDGTIVQKPEILGGHAFAIVGYDADGFWIQNSWGSGWGRDGYGHLSYDDWLGNAMDVWVARLGAPVRIRSMQATATALSDAAEQSAAYSYCDLRAHVVSVGNEGELRTGGSYGTSADDVRRVFRELLPKIHETWKTPGHLLLYAHGGLTGEKSAVQRVADYRPALLDAKVFPLAFVWKTDYWTTLKNMLEDATRRRRPEGFLDASKDFLLDRLDDALEPLARKLTGKAQWDEMKENALAASTRDGNAARLVADEIARMHAEGSPPRLHVVGHSAGSILLAPVVQYLATKGKIASGPMKGRTGLGLKIDSVTMWAPACTVELFEETYLPAIKAGGVDRFTLFTLSDAAEQDDHCANLYHKSLLFLVSNAFEANPRIPLFRDGVPLLGMEKFVKDHPAIKGSKKIDWVVAPNGEPLGSPRASAARHHGDFDDDDATVRATLARMLDGGKAAVGGPELTFHASASAFHDRRRQIA